MPDAAGGLLLGAALLVLAGLGDPDPAAVSEGTTKLGGGGSDASGVSGDPQALSASDSPITTAHVPRRTCGSPSAHPDTNTATLRPTGKPYAHRVHTSTVRGGLRGACMYGPSRCLRGARVYEPSWGLRGACIYEPCRGLRAECIHGPCRGLRGA